MSESTSQIDDLLAVIGHVTDGSAPLERRIRGPLDSLAAAAAEIARQGRFLTLTSTALPGSLIAAFAVRGEVVELASAISADTTSYPAVSAQLPAATWAERELRDLTPLEPDGIPDPRPLTSPDADAITRRLTGADAFVMPYGPVRSGVFEAIQFVIETGGEDIPLLDVRTGFKRRGLEERMQTMAVRDAVIVAERVAGIASVAHASAYCNAVERALGVQPPRPAQLWRVIHAELERIASHLHCAAQLAETTALHLGSARFTMMKEEVMRERAGLCGSRFGRGVSTPGGVHDHDSDAPKRLLRAVEQIEKDLRRDRRLLVGTTSFTDRLFGTGHLPRELAERYAVVGPVARGSGISTDARFERPYGAYSKLGWQVVTRDAGDAMARLEVRLGEIAQGIHLIRQCVEGFRRADAPLRETMPEADGTAWGWAEAPQGEVLYRVEVEAGRVRHAHVASPSLRNWQVFGHCFPRDVLTDFGFIEHSFQITPAGADR